MLDAEAGRPRRDSTPRSGTCRTNLGDVMLGFSGERNLLFGIVAFRMKLISHAELLEATREWIRCGSGTLGQVLQARNALNDDESALVDAAVEQRLEESGDDIERSLARLLPGGALAVSWPDRAGSKNHRESEIASTCDAVQIQAWARALGSAREPHSGITPDSSWILDPASTVDWRRARNRSQSLPGFDGRNRWRIRQPGGCATRRSGRTPQGGWEKSSSPRIESFIAAWRSKRSTRIKPAIPSAASGSSPRPRSPEIWSIPESFRSTGWGPMLTAGRSTRCGSSRAKTWRRPIRRFHSRTSPDFQGREFRWLLARFIDVCNTVAYAHSRGVLHRDLKPSNIMLGPFGETLVMDWGVAKLIGQSEWETPATDESPSITDEPSAGVLARGGSVTIAGQTVGTPAYMSPEQAAGRLEAVGPASDVYSLGATLYVLLTDRRPFEGEIAEVLQDGAGRAVSRRRGKSSRGCPGARRDLPAGDGPRALPTVPVGAGSGRGHRALAGGRAGLGLERAVAGSRLRRWVRRHQPLVAGWAAAVGVALLALAWRCPSLAGLGERVGGAAERTAASHSGDPEGRGSGGTAQGSHCPCRDGQSRASPGTRRARRMPTRKKTGPRRPSGFLVAAFRRPDPSIDGRSLKVVDLLDRAVHELEHSLKVSRSWKRPS